jgi:hypothetical protein
MRLAKRSNGCGEMRTSSTWDIAELRNRMRRNANPRTFGGPSAQSPAQYPYQNEAAGVDTPAAS